MSSFAPSGTEEGAKGPQQGLQGLKGLEGLQPSAGARRMGA